MESQSEQCKNEDNKHCQPKCKVKFPAHALTVQAKRKIDPEDSEVSAEQTKSFLEENSDTDTDEESELSYKMMRKKYPCTKIFSDSEAKENLTHPTLGSTSELNTSHKLVTNILLKSSCDNSTSNEPGNVKMVDSCGAISIESYLSELESVWKLKDASLRRKDCNAIVERLGALRKKQKMCSSRSNSFLDFKLDKNRLTKHENVLRKAWNGVIDKIWKSSFGDLNTNDPGNVEILDSFCIVMDAETLLSDLVLIDKLKDASFQGCKLHFLIPSIVVDELCIISAGGHTTRQDQCKVAMKYFYSEQYLKQQYFEQTSKMSTEYQAGVVIDYLNSMFYSEYPRFHKQPGMNFDCVRKYHDGVTNDDVLNCCIQLCERLPREKIILLTNNSSLRYKAMEKNIIVYEIHSFFERIETAP